MKKLVSGGIAIMLLLAAAVGIVVADDSGRGASKTQVPSALLTTEEAIQIAKSEVDGVVKEVEFERDKRRSTYEIEMHTGTKEVELKIDATTGEIIKIEQERDDDRKYKNVQSKPAAEQNQTADQPVPHQSVEKGEATTKQEPVAQNNQATQQNKAEPKAAQSNKSNQTIIGTEEAIRIAKTIADGKVEEVELDHDDGRHIYEIEIENGKYEVEIEIDAYTGEILDVEYDD